MEPLLRTKILVGLLEAAKLSHEASTLAGNWKTERSDADMLSALSYQLEKAAQLENKNQPSSKFPECTIFEEQLADLVIVALDMAMGRNLLLATAILYKLDYNLSKARVVNG